MSTRKLAAPLSVALMATALAAIGGPPVAHADLTAVDAAAALDLPAGVTVAGFSGDPVTRAVADTGVDQNADFNDLPSKGSSYMMLSTGDAGRVFEGSPSSQLSLDVGDDAVPDTSTMTLTVAQGTAGAGCLFIDFAMGTEEALGYVETVPDDVLSIASAGQEYAVNAGDGYFSQNLDEDPEPEWPKTDDPAYEVNRITYWHKPGDPLDPVPGTAETPRLAPVTGLNHVTTRDTARVPLHVAGADQEITISVADAPEAANGDLDSVAFIDNVRLRSSCSGQVGVEPYPATQESPSSCCGVIRGIRGVGNALYYDPIPSTDDVEMYDDQRMPGDPACAGLPDHECGNGWRSPSNKAVELRFRWYRAISTTYRNNGDMSKWVAIPNADRQSYVPTSVDRGKVLIVLVTGVVDGRRYETFPSTSTASTWYVTTEIGPGAFTSDVVPEVNDSNGGSVAVGDTLTAQIGNMVPRQDTYEWQWLSRSPSASTWQTISGETDQDYVVGGAQAGKLITVRATAVRDQFTDKPGLDPTPVGPVDFLDWDATPDPVIVHDGTPKYNETLTVDVGGWVPTPTSHSYQWKRNGAVITGATQPTYTINANDVGAAVTVDVSGIKTGYSQDLQTSDPVVPEGQQMLGAPVVISGTPQFGERLTASATGWSPSGSTLTYGWYADQALLQSGRSTYLIVPSGAVGKQITVRVTGTRTGYTPLTVESDPTATVAKGALTTSVPRISGYAQVGRTLTAIAGYWSPSGVKLSYRWKIGTQVVTGPAGTRTSLVIPRSARGKRITVAVTGKLTGYETVTKRSPATANVIR